MDSQFVTFYLHLYIVNILLTFTKVQLKAFNFVQRVQFEVITQKYKVLSYHGQLFTGCNYNSNSQYPCFDWVNETK